MNNLRKRLLKEEYIKSIAQEKAPIKEAVKYEQQQSLPIKNEINKDASNWASRSLFKIKSLIKGKEGKDLRSILNYAEQVKESLEDSIDLLLEGSGDSYNFGLQKINQAATVFNNINAHVSRSVLPSIIKEVKERREQEKARSEQPSQSSDADNDEGEGRRRGQERRRRPGRQRGQEQRDDAGDNGGGRAPAGASGALTDEGGERRNAPQNPPSEEQINDITEKATSIIALFNDAVDFMDPDCKAAYYSLKQASVGFADRTITFNDLNEAIYNFKSLVTEQVNSRDVTDNSKELKRFVDELLSRFASTKNKIEKVSKEEKMALYLLSLGSITTPFKKMWRGFTDTFTLNNEKKTINSLRNDCVNILEDLIKDIEEFEDIIEQSISNSDKVGKWIGVIDKFNSFADKFNSSLDTVISFYDTLSAKARHDRMVQNSKKKSKDKDSSRGFDNSMIWQDIPAINRSRFRTIKKISA